MQIIDVFNGDADGICGLVQLRRSDPQTAQLITGIKRDINLLKRVDATAGDHINVLDISFEKNATDVQRLLDLGAVIDYFDHHKTGELFSHPKLNTFIDLASDTCTSLIIDDQLKGKYRAWALTAAFGDNLTSRANKMGLESGFSPTELEQLKQLGIVLNYNGYGADLADLFFDPADLFLKCVQFDSPFDFLQQDLDTFNTLAQGYQQDMSLAEEAICLHKTKDVAVIQLPDKKWARRVSGVFSNDLANRHPERAHAILTQKTGGYLVSVRAPLNNKIGADKLVSQFPTGGGRAAAAGINLLPEASLAAFIDKFTSQFSKE